MLIGEWCEVKNFVRCEIVIVWVFLVGVVDLDCVVIVVYVVFLVWCVWYFIECVWVLNLIVDEIE